MRALAFVLALFPLSSQGQWVPRPLTDAVAHGLVHAPITRAMVIFDAGAGKTIQGTTKAEYCVEAMRLCVPRGARLEFLVDTEGTSRLSKVISPRPFSAWGLRFAANRPVTTGYAYQQADRLPVEGTLAAPMEIEGMSVTGEAMFEIVDGGPSRFRFGVLARELVWQGWRIPVGYRLDVRAMAYGRWAAEKTRAAKEGVLMELEAGTDPVLSSKAAGVTSSPDALSVQLVGALTRGEMTFAPGLLAVRIFPEGERHYTGASALPLQVGVLHVPAGSQVNWCERAGLQSVRGLRLLEIGGHEVGEVRLVRRGEANGKPCEAGEVLGFDFVLPPQGCGCGGVAPPPPPHVRLGLSGEPLDSASRLELEVHDLRKTTPCQPCRGVRP